MPLQTRSSTRTVGPTTRAASARTQSAQAPKPKLTQKRKAAPKSKSKSKPEPKPKTRLEQNSEPPSKRARRLNAKPNLYVNATAVLMTLPVEVLIEIARYVHPLDLIILSRVNKFFRELFMDKRSATIWQSALHNLPELPPCPSNVCEPQYASMIFTKRCSMCGGYAPREMDSALLVRLCLRCRERELVDIRRVTDATLVMSSRGVVPGRSHRWTSWCLYDEARAVKVKLNELTNAGDEEALRQWKTQRRKQVEARRRNAEKLNKWLKIREKERDSDLNRLRVARQEEVQSRLINLGWEKDDFICHDYWRHKQWQSMVYVTKALTDKVWDSILPSLLGHLEVNRNQRLEGERTKRYVVRCDDLHAWVNTTRNRLSPFAQALPMEHQPDEGLLAPISNLDRGFANPMVLCQAFPEMSQVQGWADYKELLENDVSHEQFLGNLEVKKPLLRQAITDWQRGLEERLIRALPDNIQPPNFGHSSFNLVITTDENFQTISTLPEDVQKLLRADTIFSVTPPNDESAPCFFPHDFSIGTTSHQIYYHSKASEIAKALLGALGSPEASYLGMRAQGKVFRCGRCSPALPNFYDWKELVKHYLESIRSWKRIARQPQVQSNKDFVYICTHDVNLEKADRPLARIGGTPTENFQWTYLTCRPCQSLGLYGAECRQYSQAIVGHLRDAHLIEAPEPGTHYSFPYT
ncbi:unnamed protein product [Rhizoctonia solani]|uniref:F-box domain-containing protein n=1 Tax=Rhizoctonia solani TaxID=456999 RepID=A0A8H3HR32_9AGAM|nr:unnamed protein product [Rhizoctonia solani]